MTGQKLLCKFLVGEIDGYEIDGAKLMKKDKKPDKTTRGQNPTFKTPPRQNTSYSLTRWTKPHS